MTTNGQKNGDSQFQLPLLINGKEVHTDTTFTVTSPVSSQPIWKASSVSRKEAIQAVDAAHAAFPSWSKTKPSTRRTILLKAADILEKRQGECIDYMKQETGALDPFCGFNMVTSVEMLRDTASRISAVSSGSLPICGEEGKNAMVIREPYGVILGIAPWNAPFILGFRAVVYALAGGNTVVFKGSELSPRCFWAIGDVLREAGLPEGVINVIYHRPEDAAEVTTALIEHPAVRKVNFTGSTAVGAIIAATAGKNLKPVLMELGGKASAIVCEDADIQKAAFQCTLGAFLHSGQICMATERILVHKSIIEPFKKAFKEAASKVFAEDEPAPILITSAGVEKNKKLVADAKSKGASIIHGDHEIDEDSKYRMRPIIVTDVTKDMDIYHTESFGPSISVIPVSSDEEAVEIANDTEYGLSGAVFTENLARGLKLARQIEAGAVHINSMTVHDEPSLPHGGTKKSGWGRFNGDWGFAEFMREKTITFSL